MSITDPWVLPKGIIITPVEELPAKLREQVEARDGDFAISRPQSRTPSRILDSQSATLLREFETPKTIGQAVAYYTRTAGGDPDRTLEDALPMLTQVIAWRLLVPPIPQMPRKSNRRSHWHCGGGMRSDPVLSGSRGQ